MKYLEKSFTVPASAGSRDYCMQHGHTLPDAHGKCLRCASHVVVVIDADGGLRVEDAQ